MASEQKSGYPLAPANGYARSDEEAAMEKELRRKKRQKCALYIILFAIFQVGVIAVFSLTVMKVKTPKFRVRTASFDSTSGLSNNSSFNLKMTANLGVKNTNWGPFKYDSTTVYFYYKDVEVGTAVLPKSKASLRSTKKVTVSLDLTATTNQGSNSELANDINSEILPLTSKSKLSGKVVLMFIMKKKKSTQMDCTMQVNIQERSLQNLQCK